MSKQYEAITPELEQWVQAQHLFFVATAPLSADGLINCSPKGMDTFRTLGPKEVGYLDLTGSGIETAAHLIENRRIVFMFCALSGPPKIVRFHGIGSYHPAGSLGFDEVQDRFPALPGTRGIVRAALVRIADSCGYAVPRYEFVGERDTLVRWAESKGADGLRQYREARNDRSIDGLPGLAEGGTRDV
ncbi:MAG: pyridoxamine 5'-phosphate oxidase family protein [Pseudomonadota bacterium]|nr:pyridoxamine 5'-phosphate oxidase family protein [Pseudomonadota bacterium]